MGPKYILGFSSIDIDNNIRNDHQILDFSIKNELNFTFMLIDGPQIFLEWKGNYGNSKYKIDCMNFDLFQGHNDQR